MKDNCMVLPPSVVLELTYRCNHRCLFCSCPWEAPGSAYPKGKELDLKEWMEVVDRLYAKGVRTFSVSGGEALLKDCLPELLVYIREEGLQWITQQVRRFVSVIADAKKEGFIVP